MAKWGIQGETGSLGQIQVGHNGQTMTQIMTSSASGVELKNINSLTASYAKITELDVYTINSIQQTESTLEVSDKKIIAAVSGSEGTSDVGLQIGGSATATELAAVLYDGANLDLRLGGSVYATMLASGAGFQVAGVLSGSGALQGASVAVDGAASVGSLNVNDGNITNVGSIALDSISADDGSSFSFGSNWTAASRTCADLGTVTTADINGGSIDGTVIGAASAAAGTFAALVGTSLNVSDGNIVNVGSISLDSIVADDDSSFSFGSNWTNAGNTVADLGTVTTADINGGSLDGVAIGAASPSTAVVTTLSGSGAANLKSLHCDSVDVDGGAIDGTAIGANSRSTGAFTTLSGSGDATLKSLHSDDVNLDGGNIDGTVIGASTAAAGTFTTMAGTSLSASSFVSASSFTLGENSATIDYSSALDLSLGSTKYAALSTAHFSASVELQGPSLAVSGAASVASLNVNDGNITNVGSIALDSIGADNGSSFSFSDDWTNASNTVADLGTVTTADINGGSIDGTVIGAASAAAGTFAALVGTSLNVSDGNITNVGSISLDSIAADDGSSFSFGSNWTAASRTCADLGTVTTADINGGSIDGTAIGAASRSTAQFTTINANSTSTLAAVTATTLSGSGAAQFASLHCDSVNLDGGAIDGTVIGAASAAAGTFAALAGTTVSGSGAAQFATLHSDSVNLDGGNIDGTIIGAASAAAGTFTSATVTSLTDGTATLTGGVLTGLSRLGANGSPITDIHATNVYTGDFHMKNERGDWTLFEESDHIRIKNNTTGQVFKMAMTLIDDE